MLIFRAIAALVLLISCVVTFGLGQSDGNYLPLGLVFLVSIVYLFLELPAKRGTVVFAFQFFAVRWLLAIAVVGIGIFMAYLGFSELNEPITFGRPSTNSFIQLVRETLGSIGVSILFWGVGVAIVVAGFRGFSVRMTQPNQISS